MYAPTTPPETVENKQDFFHWLHSCANKTPHKTPGEAFAALKRLQTKQPHVARKLQAYECRFATAGDPHYHVGHRPKRTGKRDKCEILESTKTGASSAMQFTE